ncbi:unnamed protein product [Eruca vesicaria subsp. sativa]|uniref:Small EDRK-rich factor-like N-terminal domain-containing protein n=1 Tax=Eruca vesicaria subsp. sativa TaxID=29727 RepID=A0ABC8JZA6_ERUVS|nr:unnamed protein product [Eruca vesicaria subsp. sativa]
MPIKATYFDYSHVNCRKSPRSYGPFTVEERPGEQWISLRRKFGDKENNLEIMCSAWPNKIEISKLCVRKGVNSSPSFYDGPEFEELDDELQDALYQFLEERVISDELAVFLHHYMKNKKKSRTKLVACCFSLIRYDGETARGSQRERDRERAAARAGGKGKNADDGLTPEQRRERDGKALQEKAAKKAAQAAAGSGSGGGAGGKGTAKK